MYCGRGVGWAFVADIFSCVVAVGGRREGRDFAIKWAEIR